MTPGPSAAAQLSAVDVDDGVDLAEWCYEQGWTDGRPVVPPTPDKVAAAVAAAGRPGDDVVCAYPERRRNVTVAHVAVNAVMAGCRPEYLPVVLAIVEGMAQPAFGLHAANATTAAPQTAARVDMGAHLNRNIGAQATGASGATSAGLHGSAPDDAPDCSARD